MLAVLSTPTDPGDLRHELHELHRLGARVRAFLDADPPVIAIESDIDAELSDGDLSAAVQSLFPNATFHADTPRFLLAGIALGGSPRSVKVGAHRLGPGITTLIAGPCAVESRAQIMEIAQGVREAGAHILRGGAFKPRTSPYSFDGLHTKALEFLAEAGEATGMPVVTEVLSTEHIEVVSRYADLLQVGTRNMQNFALLQGLGRAGRPVLLKRGFGCTVDELLQAAEHLMAHGAKDVILMERGIRTFEPSTRFTFDANAVALLKQMTRLPVLVDPSHATGKSDLVIPIARAAVALDADGVMVEVHNNPTEALSDGAQSLTLPAFSTLVDCLRPLSAVMGRKLVQRG